MYVGVAASFFSPPGSCWSLWLSSPSSTRGRWRPTCRWRRNQVPLRRMTWGRTERRRRRSEWHYPWVLGRRRRLGPRPGGSRRRWGCASWGRRWSWRGGRSGRSRRPPRSRRRHARGYEKDCLIESEENLRIHMRVWARGRPRSRPIRCGLGRSTLRRRQGRGRCRWARAGRPRSRSGAPRSCRCSSVAPGGGRGRCRWSGGPQGWSLFGDGWYREGKKVWLHRVANFSFSLTGVESNFRGNQRYPAVGEAAAQLALVGATADRDASAGADSSLTVLNMYSE